MARPLSAPGTLAQEFRQSWKILAGATLGMAVGVHALPFYTAGLFMASLNVEFGWSRTEMSLGPTFLVAGLALASPILGILTDRFGERRLIIVGLAVLTLALVMLSRIGGDIAHYYLLMGLMAFFASGTATPTYSKIVSRRFDAARGTAIGIAMMGTALATIAAPPVLEHILTVEGWRAGYLAMAIFTGFSTPLIVLSLKNDRHVHNAARMAVQDDHRIADILKSETFWTLAASLFAVAIAAPGLIIHFIPFLTDQGVSRVEA
ncbi:MAG: MFS transporter, partial [Burkholderiales bacterium]